MNKTNKLIAVGVTAGTLVLMAGAGAIAGTHGDQRSEKAYTDSHRSKVAVTEQQAIAAAKARHAGTVIDSHLQNEKGVRWEVRIDDGSRVHEVQVDPTTGAVVSDQLDD